MEQIPSQAATASKSDTFNSKQYKSHAEVLSNRPVTAMVDAWFNSQTRTNALGQTELFHYKWNDDSNNGYSLFGRAFQRYGVTLATLPEAPTRATLDKAQIYIIASPDIPRRTPTRTTWIRPAATRLRDG